MGLYLDKDFADDNNKAQQLIDEGAIPMPQPAWLNYHGGNNPNVAVCVVDNGHFQAALVITSMHDLNRVEQARRAGDGRPRVWLAVPMDKAQPHCKDDILAKTPKTPGGGGGLFQLGKLVSTPGALNSIDPDDMRDSLGRHAAGEWGDLDDHDKKVNADALKTGARLLSAYHDRSGNKFWIITEADRSVTTVLLPEEY